MKMRVSVWGGAVRILVILLLVSWAHGQDAPGFSLPFRPAGLWDKPNEACMTKCQTHLQKGCFKRLSKKSPAADAGAIQDMCDDKYSVCLYDCMCETCDENQIIIKEQ